MTVQPETASAITDSFTTPGTTTWTCPANVFSANVAAWGGGGSGGAGINGGGTTQGSGAGGGGGGAYAYKTVAVTPGTVYTLVVGAGGAAGTTSNPGADSSFATSAVVAKGGSAGVSVNGTLQAGAGGAGGSAAASTGDTKFSGGNGANGVSGSNPNGGGGGGSSAGTAAAGNNGSTTTGGAAVTGGGAGGGGATSSTNGTSASSPGGGGGGAKTASATQRNGGAGGNGKVTITYTAATAPVLAATTAATSITDTSSSTGGDVTSDGGSAITERGVVYAMATGPTTVSGTKLAASGTTGSFTSSLTGLSAGTTYFVRAYAVNAIGTSYGAEINFTTLVNATITGAATATAFTTTYGTASAAQTFAVGGTGLVANITATAPAGFEVSSDGTTFGTTAAFTQSGGIASGTLSVRLKADAPVTGTPYDSQNITLTSTGATTVNIVTTASGNSVSVATLSVTANNVSKPFGQTLSSPVTGSTAFTSSGLQNGEMIGSVTITYGSGKEAADPAVTYAGSVVASDATGGTFTATNYTISYVAGDITVSASPTINVTGTLSAVNTTYGTASATPTSFTTSGANLTGDLTVTAPAGFEISTVIGTGYASSLNLTAVTNAVPTTTIYVRLGATMAAGTYTGNVTVSGGGATSQSVATASSNVEPAALTITGVTGVNREYDRTTAATLSGTAAYVGLVNGETFAVTGTPSAEFANKTVGTAKSLTITGYTAPSSNYTVSQPTGVTANIAAKELTISGAAVTTKVFDNNFLATITGTLTGVIVPDDVTFVGTGTFADLNVGTGIAVTSNSTLLGTDATNYFLTQPMGLTGDITIASQTITFNALPAKTTVDAPFSLTATASSGLTVSYASSNTAVATVSGSTVTIVGVGTTTITASQAGNTNYSPAANVDQVLTVTAGPTTLAAGDVAIIGYNASGTPDTIALLILKDLNAGTTFYVNDNEVATVGGTTFVDVGEGEATFTVSAGQTVSAGTVVILPWGSATFTDSRFTWIGFTSGGLGASGGTLLDDGLYIYTGTSVTALTPTAFIYYAKGSSTSAANGGNIPAGLTSGSTAIFPTANASRYKLTGATYAASTTQLLAAIGNIASNWQAVAPAAAGDWTFSILAPQTITFGTLPTKTFGDAPFALTATSDSGLAVSYSSANTAVATIAGDTVTIVGAGSTTITASQAGNGTYAAATDMPQTLTVAKADQTISGLAATDSKTFGDAAYSLSATAGSGLAVSYFSSNAAVATVSGSTVTIVGAGSTTITASQAGDTNYNPATDATQALTVSTKAVTVTANNVTKPFGTALTGGAGSVAFTAPDLVGSDTIGSVTIAYGSGAAAGDAVGSYSDSVVASDATGGTFLAANYTISYAAGSITVSASPTIAVGGTLTAVDSTYGSPSPTPSSLTVSGGNLSGDLTVSAPAGFEVSSGGAYATSLNLTAISGTVALTTINVRLAAATAAGSYTGNVTVTGGGATAQNVAVPLSTVAPKAITITGVTGVNKVYDRTLSASVTGTPSLVGVVAGDESLVTVDGTPSATFTTFTVGTAKPVTVTGYTLAGVAAANYSVSQPTGVTADITPLALTVSDAAVTSKTFDGTTTAVITGTLSGIIAPDVVTLVGTGTFDNAGPGTAIPVTSTSTLAGADAANYSLTQPTGLTGTITGATNANLAGFTLSTGAYSRVFDAAVTSYLQVVQNTTTDLTVTPTTADTNATATVNGSAVISGNASSSISLAEGINTITITVTAQDATTTKAYTIKVVRQSATTLSTGDIAFTGFNADGNDNLAFVALAPIPQNSVIFFTDEEWNGTNWASYTECCYMWVATSNVSAGTVVSLNDLSNVFLGTATTSTGTLIGIPDANNNAGMGNSDESIYAFQGTGALAGAVLTDVIPNGNLMPVPSTFLALIANEDTAGAVYSLTGTGLSEAAGTAIIFPDDDDGMRYKSSRSGQSTFAGYLSLLANRAANWDTIGGGDGTSYLPFNATAFTTNVNDSVVTINDVSITEGDSGTTTLTFTITRSSNTGAFTINYETADSTATTADNDYASATGTLDFTAGGALTLPVNVTINGDTTTESDETFFLNLSTVVNTLGTATISDAQGLGTITNDEPVAPTFTTNPASQSIAVGATATLSVVATGSPAPTLQWYLGTAGDTANPISGATGTSFTTPALFATSSYWVSATNTGGTADSTTAVITVSYATAFSSANRNIITPNTASWNPAGVTVNGTTFVNLGLQGVGRVAASTKDPATGESLGSISDMQITGWKKNNDGTYSGTLQTLPDRGYNSGAIFSNYAARINAFDFTFTPYTSSSPTTAQDQIAMTFTGSTRFTYDHDANAGTAPVFTTGLLASGSTALFGTTVPAAAGNTTQSDGTVANRLTLDTEGLILDKRTGKGGSGWIGDEYGAFIYHFNASKQIDGQLQIPAALVPHSPVGTTNFQADPPANGRRINQGMEGIAQSPDGTKLFGLLQSATIQDSLSGNQGRFNTRLLVYDVSGSDTPNDPVAQYVIQLPVADDTGSTTNGSTVNRNLAQSAIIALNDHQLLILSRDGNGRGVSGSAAPVFKSILLADLNSATNIDGTYDAEGNTILSSGALSPSITPLNWSEALNMIGKLGTSAIAEVAKFGLNLNGGHGDINTICEKWEALSLVSANDPAFPNDYFLFVGNDNDFLSASGKYMDANGNLQDYNGGLENDTLVLAYRVRMTGSDNQSPFIANNIANQTANTGEAFSFAFDATTFADPESTTLSYSATESDDSALPAWLSFNAATRTFSGTPTGADVGAFTVKVTATDSGTPALFISTTFAITVSDPQYAPTDIIFTGNVVADDNATGVVVSTLAAVDANPGDTHTYSLVPGVFDNDNASFTIDGNQLKIQVTSNAAVQDLYRVRIRATDSSVAALSFEAPLAISVVSPGTVNFDNTIVAVDHGATSVTLNLTRSDGDLHTSVLLSTSNGTALAGTDYTAITNQVVNFGLGQNSASVNITLSGSPITSARTFTAGIIKNTSSGGAIIGATSTATIRIRKDLIAPVVAITTPLQNSTVKEAATGLKIEGTINNGLGDPTIASVSVSINGGIGIPATISTDKKKWTLTTGTAAGGLTDLVATGVDGDGNTGSSATRTFFYEVAKPIIVNNANGSLTFTPALATGPNKAVVGRTYTVKAKPNTGYFFGSWSGATSGSDVTTSFTFAEGDIVTANFTASPFNSTVAGAYNGIVKGSTVGTDTQTNAGLFTATITLHTGAFTGKLLLDGVSAPVAGVFNNVTKQFTSSVTSNGFSYDLLLDIPNAKISGAITKVKRGVAGEVISINAPQTYNKTVTPPGTSAGTYNVAFTVPVAPGTLLADEYPHGNGYGIMTISATDGTAKVVGILADGTAYTSAAILCRDATVPVFASFAARTGSIVGTALVNTSAGTTDATGTGFRWFRSENKGQFYPWGYDAGLTVDLVAAKQSTSGPDTMSLSNPDVTFSEGTFSGSPVDKSFTGSGTTFTSADKTTKLTFSTTGLMTIEYTPVTGQEYAGKGIIVSKGTAHAAYGYILSPVPAHTNGNGEGGLVTVNP